MEDYCTVCDRPLDGENVSRCAVCGGRFHMAWSVNVHMPDCGHIWFDPLSGGMSFVCNACADAHPEIKEFIRDIEGRAP